MSQFYAPDSIEIKNRAKSCLCRLGEWVWPYRCPVCEKVLRSEEGLVCEACKRKLPKVRQPVCMRCGSPLQEGRREFCRDCSGRERFFVRGASALVYEGGFRQSVLRMKFHNRRVYIPFFAACMANFAARYLVRVRPAVLLPVPMHPRKKRERGFDQCALLARELARQTGIPCMENNLVRVRYTSPQKGLSAAARQQNLAGAFAVLHPELLKEPVMLVDDIYTTGATIDACSAAIREAGLTQVFFLALCAGRSPAE